MSLFFLKLWQHIPVGYQCRLTITGGIV